eukprot:gene58009-79461_t
MKTINHTDAVVSVLTDTTPTANASAAAASLPAIRVEKHGLTPMMLRSGVQYCYSNGVELAASLIVIARNLGRPAKPLKGRGYVREVAPKLVPEPHLTSGEGSRALNNTARKTHHDTWSTSSVAEILSQPGPRATYQAAFGLTAAELRRLVSLQNEPNVGFLQILPDHCVSLVTHSTHSWQTNSKWA